MGVALTIPEPEPIVYFGCIHIIRGRVTTLFCNNKGFVDIHGNCQITYDRLERSVTINGAHTAVIKDTHKFGNKTYYYYSGAWKYKHYAEFHGGLYSVNSFSHFYFKKNSKMICMRTGERMEFINMRLPQNACQGYIMSIKRVTPALVFIRVNTTGISIAKTSGDASIVGPFVKIADKMYYMHTKTLFLVNIDDETDIITTFGLIQVEYSKPLADHRAISEDIKKCWLLSHKGEEFAYNETTGAAHEVYRVRPAMHTKPAIR